MTTITKTAAIPSDSVKLEIAHILKSLLETAQATGHWMAGQIPDVLRQLIEWTIFVGFACLTSLIVFTALDVFLIIKACKTWQEHEKYNNNKEAVATIYTIFSVMIGIVVFCFICATVATLGNSLQALIAPKVFLLEYATHLLHSARN